MNFNLKESAEPFSIFLWKYPPFSVFNLKRNSLLNSLFASDKK
ncbi:hypothetical protein LEP1GSC193_4190 [Leptospira alstonii serovar Pingchang str. 80-412]|uniref:Uncharacterized protein n=2 Tax=Leptospira alstonii TaxID=28452 RepID=M6CW82_9LEPT|nr:hypothetical protein LEP1GSC194_1847 [Leptospira alstonii serovar Sichuan str. 79601]EQA78362.1 hypothetical protein LEP1GSC193_4190 [Leptospira alstonii serovar Pingchang str. 80-412]